MNMINQLVRGAMVSAVVMTGALSSPVFAADFSHTYHFKDKFTTSQTVTRATPRNQAPVMHQRATKRARIDLGTP